MKICSVSSIRFFLDDFIAKQYPSSLLDIPRFKDSLEGHLNWLLDELEEEKLIKKHSINVFYNKGDLSVNIVIEDLRKNEIILIETDRIERAVDKMKKQKQIDELRSKIEMYKKAALTFPLDKIYKEQLGKLNKEINSLLKGK
jgi:hypothetical protein